MGPDERLTLLVIVMAFAFVAQMLGRRRIPQIIGLALVAAALGGYVVHKHREQTQEAQEQAQEHAAKRAEFESRISAYAAKYNAVADWQKPLFAKEEPRDKLYGAELAPLLVRTDRPVLLFATLRNVSESDGQAVAYFDDATSLKSLFKLQLDCSPEQAHSLMSNDRPYRLAVIAQIRSVEYVLAGDYSLAKGRCLDLMAVSFSDYLRFVVEPGIEKQVHHTGG